VNRVGIQACDRKVRICSIDPDGHRESSETIELDRPLTIEDWMDPKDRLLPAITNSAPYREPPGLCCLALPAGLYHIQKVPLELAETVDQRSQVCWEVEQTLAVNGGEYRVDYAVTGSSAIWVAIPSLYANSIGSIFGSPTTEVRLVASPIALCRGVQEECGESFAAFLVESGWVTRLQITGSSIDAVSTVSPSNSEPNGAGNLLELLGKHVQASPTGKTAIACEPDLVSDAKATRILDKLDQVRPTDDADPLMWVAHGAALTTLDEDLL
tara:strand:- start:380 stop:1189 length:810 start_codon:yes stop_codon:yes gene_type:complete